MNQVNQKDLLGLKKTIQEKLSHEAIISDQKRRAREYMMKQQ